MKKNGTRTLHNNFFRENDKFYSKKFNLIFDENFFLVGLAKIEGLF
jgi:hypothetical protein